MREKKWVDCPACGAKSGMQTKRGLTERFHPHGYPPVDIEGLSGQFCQSCGEGFWSLKSERHIARLLGAHMARYDAHRIVAADLVSVRKAAQLMGITVQGVHKMMNEGRLRYVVAGDSRLPVQKDLAEKAKRGYRSPPARHP